MELDLERQRLCLEKIEKLLKENYEKLKDTKIYRKIRTSLLEASKQFLLIQSQKSRNPKAVTFMSEIIEKILDEISEAERRFVTESVRKEENRVHMTQLKRCKNVYVSPTEHYMEHQLSLHLKKFNDRVKVMNQTNAKELNLSALEARNIHSEIFELLTKINDLTEIKRAADTEAVVSVEFDGGNF
jgi:hypothetical protein